MKKGLIITSIALVVLLASAGCRNRTTTTKVTTTNKTTVTLKTTTKENKTTSKRTTTKHVTTTEDRTLDFKEIYVSNEGLDENLGSDIENPTSLTHALEIMETGDEVFILEGTYELSETLNLSISGYQTKRGLFKGIGDVIFDFKDTAGGINITASNINIDNISVINSSNYGIYSTGSNITISNVLSENNDSGGFKIDGLASNNKIIKSLARYNYFDGSYVSGFYITSSGNNNVIDECTAYRNQNNGFEIVSKNKVVVSNSLAYENGINKDGSPNTIDGDRTGFAFNLGGHEFNNSISYNNQHSGFQSTSSIQLENIPYIIKNCSSINNGRYNYNLQSSTTNKALFNNNISYNDKEVQSDQIIAKVTNSLLLYNKEYYYVSKDDSFNKTTLFSYDPIDMSKYVDESKYKINTDLPKAMKQYDRSIIESYMDEYIENYPEMSEDELVSLIIEENEIPYEIDFYFNDNLYLYTMLNRCETFQSIFFLNEGITDASYMGAIISPFE